jgi:hypothetical protein
MTGFNTSLSSFFIYLLIKLYCILKLESYPFALNAMYLCNNVWRLIRDIRDRIYCRKLKQLQVILSCCLQSTILHIVCSYISDASTFQWMSGRSVLECHAAAMLYLAVSPQRLKIVSPSGCSSAWGRGRSRKGWNLVSEVDGEQLGYCVGCVAWRRSQVPE